jgi:hypothetical protein
MDLLRELLAQEHRGWRGEKMIGRLSILPRRCVSPPPPGTRRGTCRRAVLGCPGAGAPVRLAWRSGIGVSALQSDDHNRLSARPRPIAARLRGAGRWCWLVRRARCGRFRRFPGCAPSPVAAVIPAQVGGVDVGRCDGGRVQPPLAGQHLRLCAGPSPVDLAPCGAYGGAVALCDRIAGHVKQAAKRVRDASPGAFGLRGFFLAGGRDEQGLE